MPEHVSENALCTYIYFHMTGQYAFFANKEYIIYRMQYILPINEAMNIVDTGKDFLVRGIGFGLQKNSPYRHLFNHVWDLWEQNLFQLIIRFNIYRFINNNI